MKTVVIWTFPWTISWVQLAQSIVTILSLGLICPQWDLKFCTWYIDYTDLLEVDSG